MSLDDDAQVRLARDGDPGVAGRFRLAIGAAGGVFFDPAADAAFAGGLRASLNPAVEVIEIDCNINDPAFATAMAGRLDEHYQAWARRTGPEQEASAEDRKEAVQQV